MYSCAFVHRSATDSGIGLGFDQIMSWRRNQPSARSANASIHGPIRSFGLVLAHAIEHEPVRAEEPRRGVGRHDVDQVRHADQTAARKVLFAHRVGTERVRVEPELDPVAQNPVPAVNVESFCRRG
jgi:hypothetical protein